MNTTYIGEGIAPLTATEAHLLNQSLGQLGQCQQKELCCNEDKHMKLQATLTEGLKQRQFFQFSQTLKLFRILDISLNLSLSSLDDVKANVTNSGVT